MLSPARHHEHVPRGLAANLRYRRWLLARCAADPALQAAVRRMCREDILYWFNAFVWQHDPSKVGAMAAGPFILYPRQEELIVARPETHARLAPYDRGILWCLERDKTMACEKSRWQGASWLFLGVNLWHCGFHEYRDWLWVSRNEAAVDDGTKKSLFWKSRYVLTHQPRWLMGEAEATKLYFHFKLTDSETTGEASTAKAGVGGRGSVVAVDEYPEIDRGQEVREKTALTANSRFFVGTHLGSGTPFAQMCDPQLSPEIVRQQLHWSDGPPEQQAGMYEYDPERPTIPRIIDTAYEFPSDYPFVLDGTPTGGPAPGVRSPWYDRKCLEVGDPRAVAQNLDIDIEGSVKQFFTPARHIQRLIAAARPPVWEGELDCDREGRLVGMVEEKGGRLRLWVRPDGFGNLPPARYCAGADVAMGTGATSSCFAAFDGDRSLKVLEWADPHTDEQKFAPVCVALCRWLKDASGGGAYFGWDRGGPAGEKFSRSMEDLRYGNVYVNNNDIRFTAARVADKPGWSGNNEQRYAALKDYRNALFDGTLADRSERCLRETLRFYYTAKANCVAHAEEERSNDPTGARKNHGDLVIATIIAWMLAKEMAAGGRRSKAAAAGPEPGTLEWIQTLQDARVRRLEEVY